MSEITKLYENAEIEKCNSTLKDIIPNICLKECEEETYKCKDCEHFEYPPFTAEKQLEILCFIVNNKHSVIFHDQVFGGDKLTLEKIQEDLAWAINRIWQDLTEEEKQQVKGILE